MDTTRGQLGESIDSLIGESELQAWNFKRKKTTTVIYWTKSLK